MNKEQQLEALAKIDGYTVALDHKFNNFIFAVKRGSSTWVNAPLYLESHDAMVPLIRKCINKAGFNYNVFIKFIKQNCKLNLGGQHLMLQCLLTKPEKLAEGLLKAMGEWKDE